MARTPEAAYSSAPYPPIPYGRLALLYPDTEFKGVALVFCGWELAHRAEVLPESSVGPGLDRSPPPLARSPPCSPDSSSPGRSSPSS